MFLHGYYEYRGRVAGPPLISIRVAAGRATALFRCSGNEGQCTQLCSGGKCKTNMPYTCFPPPPLPPQLSWFYFQRDPHPSFHWGLFLLLFLLPPPKGTAVEPSQARQDF
ncbi:unnamed protein product [Gadus morhua 'NCC']